VLHHGKLFGVVFFFALWLTSARVFALHPAVVRVTVPIKEGARALGSGVLAGRDERFGYVLTAHHVVRDATARPKVRFADGSVEAGEVVKSDSAADVAVVRVKRPKVPPVEWAAASPAEGDELVAAGYGGDGEYHEAGGPVVGFTDRTKEAPAWMIFNAEVRSGDSGGPVFTEDGKLAGVLWGCNEKRTYATPVARLDSFTHTEAGRLFPIRRALSRLRR
jgi:S1-C subfamily serine protease